MINVSQFNDKTILKDSRLQSHVFTFPWKFLGNNLFFHIYLITLRLRNFYVSSHCSTFNRLKIRIFFHHESNNTQKDISIIKHSHRECTLTMLRQVHGAFNGLQIECNAFKLFSNHFLRLRL